MWVVIVYARDTVRTIRRSNHGSTAATKSMHRGRDPRKEQVTGADADAQRGRRPNAGGGCDPAHLAFLVQDHAGADEPHPRHDLRGDAGPDRWVRRSGWKTW